MKLAEFACRPEHSRGRLHKEAKDDFRDAFQRDRDRIIHSTAFRRLMHKTQVFIAHEGDHHRTRLTHSLEVAQIARALSRRLRLNEDLAELIALAHDLGHPPFGHAGEDALAKKMKPHGGFDHNAQALRIVAHIESHYPGFDGLNLSWESLEGIAKHNGPVHETPWAMEELAREFDLELASHASLEAQIAAISDDIAYNHHDLLDGLRAGILSEEQFDEIKPLGLAFKAARAAYPSASRKVLRYQATSMLISRMVEDVYGEITSALETLTPQSPQDIRDHDAPIARFSPEFQAELDELRAFLFSTLYRHEALLEGRRVAAKMLDKSFDYALKNPEALPADWRARAQYEGKDERQKARLICDYLSGMSDRFLAQNWHFAHGLDWG